MGRWVKKERRGRFRGQTGDKCLFTLPGAAGALRMSAARSPTSSFLSGTQQTPLTLGRSRRRWRQSVGAASVRDSASANDWLALMTDGLCAC